MPTTVTQLIHSSFRLIGAIAAGELLETNELNDAFVSLNQMVSSWNTEGLSLAGRTRMTVPVNSTTYSYTLAQRPARIESASLSIQGIDCPLEIVDAVGWAAVTEYAALAIQVKKLYCDYLYPTSNVYLAPTPRFPGFLSLWAYMPIAPFSDQDQIVDLPPGYEMALRYNFAMATLPEYPRSEADPTLPAQAQNYKASIVQLNASNQARTADPAAATIAAQGATR